MRSFYPLPKSREGARAVVLVLLIAVGCALPEGPGSAAGPQWDTAAPASQSLTSGSAQAPVP